MRFPILNISAISIKKSDVNIFEKYQFISLNEANLIMLQEANEYYDKISVHLLGQNAKSIKEHKQILINDVEVADLISFHEHQRQYQKDIYDQLLHKWYVEQNNRLKSDILWQQFAQLCLSNKQLNKLYNLKFFWQQQERFSYYTSNAIVEISKKILPVFEHYLDLIKLELETKKNKLPFHIRKQIQDYIINLTQALSQEKNDLIQAMLARLKVASYNQNVYFDDVTLHTAWQLSELQVLKHINGLPQYPRCGLDADTFNYFHQFIYSNGDTTQRKSLLQLNWFKTDENYLVLDDNDQCLIVPQNMKFSFRANILERLFNVNDAKRFFKDKFAFICQLRLPPKPTRFFTQLKSFYDSQDLLNLIELSDKIFYEYRKAEENKNKNFFMKWLCFRKNKLLDSWQKYLKEQSAKLLDIKLEYAVYISEQLKTRIELHLDYQDLFSKKFQYYLQEFNKDIMNHMKQLELEISDIPRYQACSTVFNKVFSLPSYLSCEGKGEDEKEKTYNLELEISDNVAIQNYDSNKLECMLKRLVQDQGYDLNDSSFKTQLSELKIFLETERVKSKEAISLYMVSIFKSYLKVWITVTEDKKENVLNKITSLESILKMLAPEFICQRLEQISTMRDSECWFVFQAKCNAILISLEDDNSDKSQFNHLQNLEKHLSTDKDNNSFCNKESNCSQLPFFGHRSKLQESSEARIPQKNKKSVTF